MQLARHLLAHVLFCLDQPLRQAPVACQLTLQRLIQLAQPLNTGTQQQLTGTGFGGVTIIFSNKPFELGSFHIVVIGGFEVGINRIALGDGRPRVGGQRDLQAAFRR